MQKNNRTIQHSGFTLIEVMVSVSIFAIILTVGIGSLLTINNAYRKSQSERVVIDNLNFVLESISREVRVGYAYECLSSITTSTACDSTGVAGVGFIDPDGASVRYAFDSNGGQGRIVKSINGNNAVGLTDPSFIVIDDLRFFVLGESTDDTIQPYVIITVTGTTTATNQSSQFTMNTSVSQRLIDRPASIITP